MLIDGKQIAEDIYKKLESEFADKTVRLGVVMSGGNEATQSYVRLKERIAQRLGVNVVRTELPETATTEDFVLAVGQLSGHTDGIVVQLPLPEHIDVDVVLATIPADKDIDALNHETLYEDELVHAPVAEAVLEIFERAQVRMAGKKAAVVGMGRLVGIPVSEMLIRENADVEMFIEGDTLDALNEMDIVVTGVGKPGLITPAMLKAGVVLIDAGTSEQNGKLAGDSTPECSDIASVYTPVPGGVGPIAVAMLFSNLSKLIKLIKN